MAEEEKKKEGYGEDIEVVKAEREEEKDVEIDLGKITSFFKRRKKQESSAEDEKAEGKKAAEETTAESHEQGEHKKERRKEEDKQDSAEGQEERKHNERKEEAKSHLQHGRHKRTEASHEKEEDGEIDLGRLTGAVKGLFKKAGEQAGEAGAKEQDEDLAINTGAVLEFLKKRGPMLLLILGIVISVSLVAHVRTKPANLPFADRWASDSIDNAIRNDIVNAVNQQYPNLPEGRKSQLVEEQFREAKKSNTYVFRTGENQGLSMNIEQQIQASADGIKNFYRDENGKAYSPDIDPYYWYRYAKNIVEKGHIGDEVRNGVQRDTRQLAPYGRSIAPQDTFFPHFIANLYRTIRIFSPNITLFEVQTTAYPVIITGLTALLIFLTGRKIAGNIAGFFGSLMGGLHIQYVVRTIHGDNDAMVIFFAILTLWLFIESVYANKAMFRLGFAALAGFSAYLFSLSWGGWWFIIMFILGAAAAAAAAGLANSIIKSVTENGKISALAIIKDTVKGSVGKHFIIPAAVFFFSTGLFISAFTGINRFVGAPFLALGITEIKTPVLGSSFWPNVLTTVAELNPGSFQQTVQGIKPGIFWAAIAATVILLAYAVMNFLLMHRGVISENLKEKLNLKANEEGILYAVFFATLIIMWFVGTVYATTKGQRFILLLAPIAGLGFGMLLGMLNKLLMWVNRLVEKDRTSIIVQAVIYALISLSAFFMVDPLSAYLDRGILDFSPVKFLIQLALAVSGVPLLIYVVSKAKELSRDMITLNRVVIGVLAFTIIAITFVAGDTIRGAYGPASNNVPIMNDAWYSALTAIRDNSSESAIITSWWDFGHHFKAITGRKVTFDGTTQQGPQAHWVGKFFMTENETEAAGILRMLDCGSDRGFLAVNAVKNDFAKSIRIIERLTMSVSREEAEQLLINEYDFSGEQVKNVTENTHCGNPPEGYVIASEDMIGKSGVWGHFGSWDFERAIIWQTLRKKSEQEAVEAMKRMFNYTDEHARTIYSQVRRIRSDNEGNTWIAPWPSFDSSIAGCGARTSPENETLIICNNGLLVNMTTNDAYFRGQGNAIAIPKHYVYLSEETGKVERKTYPNSTENVGVIVVPQGNGYFSVISSPEQAGGMFTKMFFFEGRGLEHFDMVANQRGFTGTNVYVYKTDWDSLK